MAEMSIIWLRVAAGLYSLGLLDAILTIIQRRARLFGVVVARGRIVDWLGALDLEKRQHAGIRAERAPG